MLNRIYIIVGTLAIIVLAGAFLVPRFVQWGDYRERMEELASGLLGSPVSIRGDIDFSLLPQPRLTFSDVVVGSADEPSATVEAVEAEFSLMEFLRDDYNITRLVLRGTVLNLVVDENGLLGSGVSVQAAGSEVGLGEATIEDATVRLSDRRSSETFSASDIDGQLRLVSFAGPISFQGAASYEGERYAVRLNASEPDALGNNRVSGAVLAESGAFSLTSDGMLSSGIAPKFDGTLTYRQAPPEAAAADDIRGHLVFESKVIGSTDRIVMSGYTLQPDENRAGTRLTGAASIQLGAHRSFDAVISGGVFSLPPRDANEDSSAMPYEAVRLLSELPAPIIPPMPGRIGVDLAEVGLRGFSVRNMRLDASTDGVSWQVEQLIGQLPGDTEIRAKGALDNKNDRPEFRGSFTLNSQRLDALVALWRKPGEDNLLFNQSGSLEGRLMLVGDALGFSAGKLTLAGQAHSVELRLGFGDEKRLDLVSHFSKLGANGSTVVGAMLPNISSDPAFGISFPFGSFSLSGDTARLFDLDGADMLAEGQWAPGEIKFNRLSAADWGGANFDLALVAGGTLAAPKLSGKGQIGVDAGDAPALQAGFNFIRIPENWRALIARSAPADLQLELQSADEDGEQVLTAGGQLGAGVLDLRAELGGGLARIVDEPLRLTASLESDDPTRLSQQLGLGASEVFTGDTMLATIGLQGTPGNSLDTRLALSSDGDWFGFSGDVYAGANGEIAGSGNIDLALADAGGLAQIVGANGLSLPLVRGSASLDFEGTRLARLADIVGTSDEAGFSGELSLSRTAGAAVLTGALDIDTVSIEGLAATLFGRAALIGGDGIWPEGPIAIGAQARSTRGSVTVTTSSVSGGDVPRLGEASFELSWDDSRLRLARFTAALGTGQVVADITVCCAGTLAEKTVSGRLSVTSADFDTIVPPAVGDALNGTLDGGLRFEATGASIADLFGTMAGEGNFSIADFRVDQMAPGVFPTVAGLDGVLELDPDALGAIISLAMGQGSFVASQAEGAFAIAGGVVRLSNMIVEGDGARLAGSLSLSLGDLGLDGRFMLTPLGFVDPIGLVAEDTARIITRIAGTLMSPLITLDLAEMVATIQVRANEIEVDRLEVLRAEDAERQRAAAEARNKLIQEQRRRAEEEAARLAAEEEAQRLEEERQQQEQSPSIQTLPEQQFNAPLTLGFQPEVNQPIGDGVNQPFTPAN